MNIYMYELLTDLPHCYKRSLRRHRALEIRSYKGRVGTPISDIAYVIKGHLCPEGLPTRELPQVMKPRVYIRLSLPDQSPDQPSHPTFIVPGPCLGVQEKVLPVIISRS